MDNLNTDRWVSEVVSGMSASFQQSIITTNTTFYCRVYSNCPWGPSLPTSPTMALHFCQRVSWGATDSQLLTLRRPQELCLWRGIHNDTGESHTEITEAPSLYLFSLSSTVRSTLLSIPLGSESCVSFYCCMMNMCVSSGVWTLTSGAIQNGVPTDVFLRNRALVSWAETPKNGRTNNINHHL